MKVFSKIKHTHHILGSNQVEIHTHYYLFDWNFWTSCRQEAVSHKPEWKSLKQNTDGQLEVDELCEYLEII